MDTIETNQTQLPTLHNQYFLDGERSNLFQGYNCGIFSLGITSQQTNYSIITNLFSQNKISVRSFSLFLNDIGFNGDERYNEKSSIGFGGYDLKKYALNHHLGLKYHNVIKGYHNWTVQGSSFLLGKSVIVQNMSIPLTLEPGFSFIVVPREVLKILINKIQSKIICNYNESGLFCPCDKSFSLPDLVFTIDSISYSLTAKDYIRKINSTDYCVLCVGSEDANLWILGQIFLRRYYSYYDMSEMTVGLTKSIIYTKKSSKSSKPISDEWLITIICVSTCIVLGGAITLCWVYLKHKRPYRNSIMSSDSDYMLK